MRSGPGWGRPLCALGVGLGWGLVAAAPSDAAELTIDEARSSVTLVTDLTPDDPITVALGGVVELVTDPGSPPFSTAGIPAIDAVVTGAVVQEVSTALGILAFNIPGNTVTVSATAEGSIANAVDGGGGFTQGDLLFTLAGVLSGDLLDPDSREKIGSFSGDLVNATAPGGGPLAGQSIDAVLAEIGGATELTASLALDMILPITAVLGDFALPLDLGVSVDAQLVAGGGPAGGLPGDLNGDGFVGAGDLDVLLGVWNQSVGAGVAADLNGDGFVGAGDLDVLLGNWNAGTPGGGALAVPEPGAGALALLALSAGVLRRRRGA